MGTSFDCLQTMGSDGKISGLIVITCVDRTPICEWCIIRCGSKNGHHKDMFSKEVGLHVQHLLTILGSIVNIIGGTCATT